VVDIVFAVRSLMPWRYAVASLALGVFLGSCGGASTVEATNCDDSFNLATGESANPACRLSSTKLNLGG